MSVCRSDAHPASRRYVSNIPRRVLESPEKIDEDRLFNRCNYRSGTSRFNRELSSFVLGQSCNYVLSVVGFAFLNRMLIRRQFSEGFGGFLV